MAVSVKSESLEIDIHPSCDDESPSAVISSVISLQHVEQPKDATPGLLYPIGINSEVSVFTDQKVLNVVKREEPRKGTAALGYPEAVSTSSEFTHRAIVHLIEAMHRCWDMYGSQERSRLFQNVQSELENFGHSLPVEKVRRKWNNLIVTYKRVKERSRLGRGQAKTSWEYFEMMDKVLGKKKINQNDTASATLVGYAATAKTANWSEEPQTHSVSVATVATPCLRPSRLFTAPSPIPTLVASPLLCNTSPNPRSVYSTDTPIPTVSPSSSSRITRQPLKRRFRHHQLGSAACRFGQKQGNAGERTALLRNFLTTSEERAHLDEQRQRKKDARERRQERTLGSMAESMGRMATALELISSKQDTIIALLQRLSDKR